MNDIVVEGEEGVEDKERKGECFVTDTLQNERVENMNTWS
jgi:hypothetical protein